MRDAIFYQKDSLEHSLHDAEHHLHDLLHHYEHCKTHEHALAGKNSMAEILLCKLEGAHIKTIMKVAEKTICDSKKATEDAWEALNRAREAKKDAEIHHGHGSLSKADAAVARAQAAWCDVKKYLHEVVCIYTKIMLINNESQAWETLARDEGPLLGVIIADEALDVACAEFNEIAPTLEDINCCKRFKDKDPTHDDQTRCEGYVGEVLLRYEKVVKDRQELDTVIATLNTQEEDVLTVIERCREALPCNFIINWADVSGWVDEYIVKCKCETDSPPSPSPSPPSSTTPPSSTVGAQESPSN
jgi:hypothetical protein